MTDTRKEELTALGAKFDDLVYTFDYAPELFIGEYQLSYYTDEQFGDFLEDVKTAFAEEQTRIYVDDLPPYAQQIVNNTYNNWLNNQ